MKLKPAWIVAIIPIVAMVLIAMYPQISLWRARGDHWAGSYSAANYDEVAYSAYINGLMNGKSRKYDPMMGSDHDHESIFSIQFIPAYSVALPARLLGVTASTAFIALQIFIAVLSVLALFGLFRAITGDEAVAAAGSLVVLCLGTAITYEGSLRDMVDGGLVIEYLPFLRRYQPGFAFPIFFLMCVAVWKALTDATRTVSYAVVSGMLFAILVYSYFYLWTTATVWLGLVFLTAFLVLRHERAQVVRSCLTIAGFAIAALLPYLILLNMRSRNSDEVQLLSLTHAPDLTAPTVLVGFLFTLVAILLGVVGRIDLRSPAAVFSFAFLLTPLGVLNQQVVTGRSLQPVHYEIFIANYCVLAGVVLVFWLALVGRSDEKRVRGKKIWAVAAIAVLATGWGFQEAWHASTRNAGMAAVRDAVYPAAEFIRDASEGRDQLVTIHTPNQIAGSFIPSVVPSRILWNPHLVAGGSLGEHENKLQFYRFLYYSGFGAADLDNALKMGWFEMRAAIFGGGRALPQLGGVNHPITDEEITEEVEKYRVFTEAIDETIAYSPRLDYIIVSTGDKPNFANVDRWYSRDASYVMGDFTVWALSAHEATERLAP
jgi:hypothetical protein